MEVALLLLHKDSMAAIFDSSATAGASVFPSDKGCILRAIMRKDLCHCLSFVFLCVAVSDFRHLAVPQTPLHTKDCKKKVNSWDFLWQSISKPKCLSCALTAQTPGSFWEPTTRCTMFFFAWIRAAVLSSGA